PLLWASTFWTSSGSCPLCLTPPFYHLEPPVTAALFCAKPGHPNRPKPCDKIRIFGSLPLQTGVGRGMLATALRRIHVEQVALRSRPGVLWRQVGRLPGVLPPVPRGHVPGRGNGGRSRWARPSRGQDAAAPRPPGPSPPK